MKDLYKGRREHYEITAEILKAAWNGAVKTHLLRGARLSCHQMRWYLPKLVEEGLLECFTVKERKRTKRIFKTTKEGKHFVENFDTLKKLEQLGQIPF